MVSVRSQGERNQNRPTESCIETSETVSFFSVEGREVEVRQLRLRCHLDLRAGPGQTAEGEAISISEPARGGRYHVRTWDAAQRCRDIRY